MKTTLSVAALLLFTGLFSPPSAEASSLYRIDRLAFSFQRQTVGLVRELEWGYRDMPQYEHLYKDAVEMYKLARHVNELIYERADTRHIAADVKKLDGLFHHVEELVGEMSVKAKADFEAEFGADAPAFSGPGPFGVCRGPNCDYGLRALEWRLDDMERTLHVLLDDVKPFIVEPAVDVIPPVEAAPATTAAPLTDVIPAVEAQ